MFRIKVILLIFILNFVNTQTAIADSNDSCVASVITSNDLLANLTTLGLFSAYSANFSMTGAGTGSNGAVNGKECDANYYPQNGSGSPCYNAAKYCSQGQTISATGTACAVAGATCDNSSTPSGPCNPNGGLQLNFIYTDDTLQQATHTEWVTAGWNKFFLLPPATIQVQQVGSMLCVQFLTAVGYQNIGCKYLPDCSTFSLTNSCYVADSCSNPNSQHSLSIIGISATIIQCITESIDALFVTPSYACGDASSGYQATNFSSFQNQMRNAVRSALMLYIIFFGIKMALGGKMPDKGEFFKFGAKFILVSYFSVGLATGSTQGGKTVYDDGVSTLMLPFFQYGAADLANMVYQSGGARGLCDYSQTGLQNLNIAYQSGYEYLSLWDSLDCRILYYLGFNYVVQDVFNPADLVPVLFALILPAFFAFQVMFAVFSIIFAVMVISVVVYLVNLMVISLIAMAILIYLAPLFVPMALFEQTKTYFDGWLRLVISYSLQPMVVAAYVAMMMTIYDQIVFGDCVFENISLTTLTGKTIPYFQLCDPHGSSSCGNAVGAGGTAVCNQTIGYMLNSYSQLTSPLNAIFFTITLLNPATVANSMMSLITLCLFGYLFYKFGEMLSQFAAELTGGTNLGAMAGGPMRVFDKAAALASAYVKSRMGDKEGAAKDLKKAAGKDDPPPGGSGASASRAGAGASGAKVSSPKPK